MSPSQLGAQRGLGAQGWAELNPPPQLSPPAPSPAAVPVLASLLCPWDSELGVEGCHGQSPPIHCPCLLKTGCRLGLGG